MLAALPQCITCLTLLTTALCLANRSMAQAGITEMDLIPGVGDFESAQVGRMIGEDWDLWYWTPASPIQPSVDRGNAKTGTACQRFDILRAGPGDSTAVALLQTQELSGSRAVASPGRTYRISYWMKTSEIVAGVTAQVWIEHGAGGQVLGSFIHRPLGPQEQLQEWTQYAFDYTAPANAGWFRLMFRVGVETGPAAGTLWLDDVSMKDGTPFPPVIQKSLKAFCIGSYQTQDNWLFRATHYDGGRWEIDEPMSLYSRVRPDGLNGKAGHVSYSLLNTSQMNLSTLLPYTWLATNHPEWFLKFRDPVDKAVKTISYGPHLALDFSNPELQTEVAARYAAMTIAEHTPAVFWDAFDVHARDTLNGQTAVNFVKPTFAESDALWQAAIIQYMQTVAPPIQNNGTKVIVNIAHCPTFEEPLRSWLNYIDGMIYELGFVVVNPNGVPSAFAFSSWRYKFLSVATAPLDKIIIMCTDGGHINALRHFGIAGFLCAMQPNSYISLSSIYGANVWHTDLEAPLGLPLGPFTVVDGDMSDGCLMKRYFENGVVFCNASIKTRPAILGASYVNTDGAPFTAGAKLVDGNDGLILIGANPPDTDMPTVEITFPLNATEVRGVKRVEGGALDSSGISKVEFLVDGVQLGYRYDAPYQFSWDTRLFENGPHTLTYVAYDAYNKSTTSESVIVQVNNDIEPPLTSFIRPTDGGNVAYKANVEIVAADNIGVEFVRFYVGNSLVKTLHHGPFAFQWDTREWGNGNYELTARANDSSGNVGESKIRVNVRNLPPRVSIVAPTDRSLLTGYVTVSVDATATNAIVDRVEILFDGQVLKTMRTAPYTFEWDTSLMPNGFHRLAARAVDAYRKATTSTPISVSIQN